MLPTELTLLERMDADESGSVDADEAPHQNKQQHALRSSNLGISSTVEGVPQAWNHEGRNRITSLQQPTGTRPLLLPPSVLGRAFWLLPRLAVELEV